MDKFSPAARFALIARRYDLANTILSCGLHQVWKRQAIAAARLRSGDRVLDAGTGKGDLAALAARLGARVTAVDISPEMLQMARRKRLEGRLAWVRGDLGSLPFHPASFDVVVTRAAHRLYSAIIPSLGGRVTGDPGAYAYLVESIRRFPGQAVLTGMLSDAGFTSVAYRNLTGGIVAIHTAAAPS